MDAAPFSVGDSGAARRAMVSFPCFPGMIKEPCTMADQSNVVSIHPYFKIHEGKLDEVKALLPAFVAKVENEDACLYYNFTLAE